MKEELTREVLEAMAKCKKTTCEQCRARTYCSVTHVIQKMEDLTTALLEEMDKPKVWDGAPADAVRGITNWFGESGAWINSTSHTRELPKTRARIMAEEIADGYLSGMRFEKSDLVEMLESALNKYAEELEGKE